MPRKNKGGAKKSRLFPSGAAPCVLSLPWLALSRLALPRLALPILHHVMMQKKLLARCGLLILDFQTLKL
jgi:hypothetical protein